MSGFIHKCRVFFSTSHGVSFKSLWSSVTIRHDSRVNLGVYKKSLFIKFSKLPINCVPPYPYLCLPLWKNSWFDWMKMSPHAVRIGRVKSWSTPPRKCPWFISIWSTLLTWLGTKCSLGSSLWPIYMIQECRAPNSSRTGFYGSSLQRGIIFGSTIGLHGTCTPTE